MRLALIVAFLLGSGGLVYAAQQHADQKKFYLVQKVYVGDMGNDDEAERFRFLLEEQLSKKGFIVVNRAEDADAVLRGALSVRAFNKKAEARVYVKLEALVVKGCGQEISATGSSEVLST